MGKRKLILSINLGTLASADRIVRNLWQSCQFIRFKADHFIADPLVELGQARLDGFEFVGRIDQRRVPDRAKLPGLWSTRGRAKQIESVLRKESF